MSLDFGYPWWLTYGHLVVLVPALLALWLGRRRGWGKWAMFTLGAVALWAAASTLMLRTQFRANDRGELPVQSFLASGRGRVLDIGVGTGRSSVMVLEARPQATLVALDEFGHSYDHHFGEGAETGQQRLRRNLEAAGVAARATIETADMRKLPFGDASFDAVMSAYAMDHLPRQGSLAALAEAARVLKPGGEFLLMLVENDRWTRFAFGPLLSHGGTRWAEWWRARVTEAGFELVEQGSRPATLYLLGRKR